MDANLPLALERCAAGLVARHEAIGRPLGERQDLVPEARRAIGSTLSGGWRLAESEQLFAPPEWPRRAGGVDLVVLSPEGRRVFIEAKCGASELYNCVWDVAKLGLADALGACDRGYLLTAAPGLHPRDTGAELLRDAEHGVSDLLGPAYLRYWYRWLVREGQPAPLRLPTRLRTQPLHCATITLAGDRWYVQLTEVQAAGELIELSAWRHALDRLMPPSRARANWWLSQRMPIADPNV